MKNPLRPPILTQSKSRRNQRTRRPRRTGTLVKVCQRPGRTTKRDNQMARIGIDLGTTFSVAATMEDGRVEVLTNAEGKSTTPSVVYFQDSTLDNAIVGQAAV